jgi:hypothetical protein
VAGRFVKWCAGLREACDAMLLDVERGSGAASNSTVIS